MDWTREDLENKSLVHIIKIIKSRYSQYKNCIVSY